MAVDAGFVRKMFAGLEQGDGAGFFAHVADDVDWTVMGTHPLAGHYTSKADFIAGTFAKLGKVLPNGAQLHVDDLIVTDDVAIIELHSEATRQERLSLRQSLLLGLLLQKRCHRARARLSRFGDGRATVCGEPDLAS